MIDCKVSRGRYGVRRGVAAIIAGCISLLVGRGFASDISHTDYYDFSLKKFYIEKITFEGDALRILPVSFDPKIQGFEFKINGQASRDGLARLPRNIQPKSYAFHALIKLSGSYAEETVDFTFYPAKLYEQKGRMSEGNYIIIHKATVAAHKPSYVYQTPSFTAEDLAFARQTWGNLMTPRAGDIALAQAIAEDIVLRLEAHRGIPSDIMNTSSPRVQFERAVGGRDRVWCGDLAVIFQYVCVSLGLEARVIHTGADMQQVAPQVRFLQTESHATVEVYSRETRSWVWLDPTGYVLEATIDGAPLTLLHLVEALGTPLEEKIMVATFDAKAKRRLELPLSQSPAAAFIKNYFRPGVRLKY
jgi:hypothetical protein